MTLRTEIIDALREIVGDTNVLIDIEDRYVYSYKQIYRERYMPEIDAVVKTESSKGIDKVLRLADEEGFSAIQRGKTIDPEKITKPIVLIDNFELVGLEPFQNSLKAGEDTEFRETERGTLKKLALAQRILFLNKPMAKCQECSACRSYCTVASSFKGIETWSAKGRMLLLKGMLQRELPATPKIIDIIYTCSNCGLCFAECLQSSEFPKAIRAARRQIVLEKLAPKNLEAAAANILNLGDPGGRPSRKRRLSWLKTLADPWRRKNANVLYWVGCTVATRTPKTAKAVVNILNFAKIGFSLLGESEGCCGYILLTSGLWDEAKRNATTLVKRIEKSRAKSLITTCAGCYYTFSKLFPEILEMKMPCNVFHVSQFMENLIGEEGFDPEFFDAKVTYHDPCSLGRHAKVYDAPRNVLSKIPGLRFIEMPLNKEHSRCCGGGGGLWSYNNQVSLNSAFNRLTEDVIPLNLNILATSCPICQMNMRFASIRNSIPVRVLDFTEIVESAVTRGS
ncbi:MAG: (Fe-S)-binding protein [Candidatus Bathyarchaeota archaeon]|nr:MAG: (Fe-S)-binding protein [Candidatus Bathyarchaeota archaeon]